MKKSKKTLFSIFSFLLLTTPFLSSCGNGAEGLNLVNRGNGDNFAFSDGNDKVSVSFYDQLYSAIQSNDGFKSAKKQIVNEILYDWYYREKERSDAPQIFKDNWSTWTNEINKDYDSKVQDVKNQHSKNWKYYLQNTILNDDGGSEESWKFNQMCSKIRSNFTSNVFAHNYLSYSSNPSAGNKRVNSSINSFSQEIFNDSKNWINIDFYAYANPSYSSQNNDLDDVYALIQKEAFNQWTSNTHPISVSMSLWKYAAPSSGLETVYDKSRRPASTTNDDSFSPSYSLPSFPAYEGSSQNANSKFFNFVSKFLTPDKNFALDSNGVSVIRQDSAITDDSATSIIVTSNDAFGSLDTDFAATVSLLYSRLQNNDIVSTKYFLPYNATKLNQKKASDTDILHNFLFASADERIWTDSSLTSLGINLRDNASKVDLSQLYESNGTPSSLSSDPLIKGDDFHSYLFDSRSNYYKGMNSQGGIQFVVSSLDLTDDANVSLPYALIRDAFGVHLIGINGADSYKNGSIVDGYLKQPKSSDNNQTEKFSQGRQNLLLSAQTLFQKLPSINEKGIDVTEKIKSYFDSNLDDIILQMAKTKVKRANRDEEIIFNDSDILNQSANEFYSVVDIGNKYFEYQATINAYDNANKKMFDNKFNNAKNNLFAFYTKKNQKNYTNGLANPYPFLFVNGDYDNNNILLRSMKYDVTALALWMNFSSFNDATFISLDKDMWSKNCLYFFDINGNFRKIKSTFNNSIEKAFSNVLPDVRKDFSFMEFSENIYPEWKNRDKKDSINNAAYKALVSNLSNNDFNSLKIKAFQYYSSDIYKSIDDTSCLANISDSELSDAIASLYVSKKIINDKQAFSYFSKFKTINSENYSSFLLDELAAANYKSFSSISSSSDLLEYWTLLATISYLIRDNYSELLKRLNNDIQYPSEADIIWVVNDNITINSSFGIDKTNDIDFFDFLDNYVGNYNSNYLDVSNDSNEPSSYVENKFYSQFAKMPTSNKISMGYVGLYTQSNSSSLGSVIQDMLFTNTYYSKIDNNQNHLGGWNKYISIDRLKEFIREKKTSFDLQSLVKDMSQSNLDQDFTSNVVDIVNRNAYQENDPDRGEHKVGESVNWDVMQKRFLGDEECYKSAKWGLASYIDNHALIVKSLFDKFGSKNGASELFDASNPSLKSHVIKSSSDSSNEVSRVYTVQLNSDDIKDISALRQAIPGNLLSMVAVQYALLSSIQSDALNSIIKDVFNNKKIKVFDRRFNDKLGNKWVSDWKSTN